MISSPEQTLKKQLAADRERIIRAAACAITKSVDFGQSHFAPEVSAIKPTMSDTEQYTNQLDATKESKNCARTHTSGCWVPFFCGNKSRRQGNLPWGPPIDCAHTISIRGLFFRCVRRRAPICISPRDYFPFFAEIERSSLLLFQWSSLIRFECIMPLFSLFATESKGCVCV